MHLEYHPNRNVQSHQRTTVTTSIPTAKAPRALLVLVVLVAVLVIQAVQDTEAARELPIAIEHQPREPGHTNASTTIANGLGDTTKCLRLEDNLQGDIGSGIRRAEGR